MRRTSRWPARGRVPLAGRRHVRPSRGPVADSIELASWLLEEAHVAVLPGKVFGAPEYLRISFAVDHNRLAEAAGRLAAALG